MKAEREQEKQAFLAKQSRAETLQVDIEKFQSSVDQVLQVEAERRQLNRDYAIVKGNHQQMLERIEKARLTREVETSNDLGVRDRPAGRQGHGPLRCAAQDGHPEAHDPPGRHRAPAVHRAARQRDHTPPAHRVASRYPDRIVPFDSPPVRETTEASVLASLMGQVALVVEQESTAQGIVKETMTHFEPGENVYLVLNKCKAASSPANAATGMATGTAPLVRPRPSRRSEEPALSGLGESSGGQPQRPRYGLGSR